MRGNQRILLIAAAVVVAVVAFIVVSPGGNDNAATTSSSRPAATPAAPDNVTDATVNVVDAKPQGGIKTVTTKEGNTVNLTVNSDTADEIHVHGYDIKKDIKAGGSVTFSFKASIVGVFEAELESRSEQIVKLVVEQ